MNSTASWSAADTALFVMRTTVTSTSQRTRGSAGDAEHYALHHTKAQAQGKRGQECGGTTAGTEVPRVQLYGWSGHQAHDCAQISGTVQATNPGDHAKGQGRQHQDDNGRVGHVYAGQAQLFRLLRNARGAGRSHSLGPVATAGRSVASVENATASPSGTHRAWSSGGVAQYGRQRPWPLASGPEQSPLCRALQCPFQIAWSSELDRSALASTLEPPYTDPYVRWCGRGGAARLPPIPILGTFGTCQQTRRM